MYLAEGNSDISEHGRLLSTPHLPNFAQRTFYLRQLIKKGHKFKLSPESDMRTTFLAPDVLLQYPDWNKVFNVHPDASKRGLGAVLMQKDVKTTALTTTVFKSFSYSNTAASAHTRTGTLRHGTMTTTIPWSRAYREN